MNFKRLCCSGTTRRLATPWPTVCKWQRKAAEISATTDERASNLQQSYPIVVRNRRFFIISYLTKNLNLSIIYYCSNWPLWSFITILPLIGIKCVHNACKNLGPSFTKNIKKYRRHIKREAIKTGLWIWNETLSRITFEKKLEAVFFKKRVIITLINKVIMWSVGHKIAMDIVLWPYNLWLFPIPWFVFIII